MEDRYIRNGKLIIFLSVFVFICSITIYLLPVLKNDNNIFEFEYINTKDMARTNNSTIRGDTNILSMLNRNSPRTRLGEVEEYSLNITEEKKEEIKQPERIWYLPTNTGRISQYPSYGHAAYDITSPNGQNEVIFPIANGTISSIYRDNYGALIVSVRHEVDGRVYTSLYAHLSRYASDLYVGKPVTINDALGQMGTTGLSTGVHLHIVVADDCDFNRANFSCGANGNLFSYVKRRNREGFYGLGSVMNVPGSWDSR